jgi:type II secretory pathway pseudopilin PulG
MFEQPKAPATTGGMMWDANTQSFVPIPGWQSSAPVVNVNSGPNVEAIAAEEMAKVQGKSLDSRVTGYVDSARKANDLQSQMNRFSAAMSRARSGGDEQLKKTLREWGNTFGYPIDEEALANAQSLDAAAKSMVAEQLRMNAGPQTDFDTRFAQDYLPGLSKLEDANKEIVRYYSSMNKLNQIFGNMANASYGGNFSESFKNLGVVDQYKMNAPAVIQNPQTGQWADFSTFYRMEKKKGLNDRKIIDNWIEIAGQMRQ